MKNLILTFVFALVSLVSFTQISYIINADTSEVVPNQPNIVLINGDSIKFDLIIGWGMYEMNSSFTEPDNSHNLLVSEFFKFQNDTVYVRFAPASGLAGINVTIIFCGTTTVSVSENTLTREELKVYPSPATSDIKISFLADKSDMTLNIFSLNGQLVHQDNTSREVGSINIIELNVSGWLSGIYFVKVGNHTEKLIIE